MKEKGIIGRLEKKKQQLVNGIEKEKSARVKLLEQEYNEKLENFKKEHQKQLETDLRKEIKFQLAEKKLELIHTADQVKIKIINEVLDRVKDRLDKIDAQNSERYYNFLNNSIKENLRTYIESDDKITLHIRKVDQSHLTIDTEDISIKTDLDVLGSKIVIENKNIVIDDSITVRFESTRRYLLKELNKSLFEGVEVPQIKEEDIITELLSLE